MKKIYLAIPYTGIEEISCLAVNEITAKLILQDYCVFSPISHSHNISLLDDGSKITYQQWMNQDLEFLTLCDAVYVVDLINHHGLSLIYNSKGVMQEIEWAREFNKELKMIKYNTETKQLEI